MSWMDDPKARELREASESARADYVAAAQAATIAAQQRNRLRKRYRAALKASVDYNESIDPLPPLAEVGRHA